MKLLYVTDLHGCEWKFEQAFKAAKKFKADVFVNGGDMLPGGMELFEQDKFITNYLDNHFERFDSEGIYYLCILGNDDLKIFDDVLEETCKKHSYAANLAQRKFKVGDFEFIGMNFVKDYPFLVKDRCRIDMKNHAFENQYKTGLLSTPVGWEKMDDWSDYKKTLSTIEDELNRLPLPEKMENAIYVIHMPPSRLGLDWCFDGREVGSEAVYRFLEKHQPKLSLHGHIHESPDFSRKWHVKLGNTICIQPGQLSEFTYVTIDLASMKFERFVEYYQE